MTVNKTVIGISASPVRIRKMIEIEFLPWFASEKIKAIFYVLPKTVKWESEHPNCDIPCRALSKPLIEPLADPFFWKSDKVSMLFGIELWARLMKDMHINWIPV